MQLAAWRSRKILNSYAQKSSISCERTRTDYVQTIQTISSGGVSGGFRSGSDGFRRGSGEVPERFRRGSGGIPGCSGCLVRLLKKYVQHCKL